MFQPTLKNEGMLMRTKVPSVSGKWSDMCALITLRSDRVCLDMRDIEIPDKSWIQVNVSIFLPAILER